MVSLFSIEYCWLDIEYGLETTERNLLMIKHIVLLKIKETQTSEEIHNLFEKISALQDKIPGIMEYSSGAYSSPEGLNHGYTHGFIMTFKSAESRDSYLKNPEHEKVKEEILTMIDDALAFDFDM